MNQEEDYDPYEGLPMPIQDNDFDEFVQNQNEQFGLIDSDGNEPDFSKMSNGKDLEHLKLANMNKKKNGKGIDIRKGINIEKKMKMVTDENGGMKPSQEFDLIQHS